MAVLASLMIRPDLSMLNRLQFWAQKETLFCYLQEQVLVNESSRSTRVLSVDLPSAQRTQSEHRRPVMTLSVDHC